MEARWWVDLSTPPASGPDPESSPRSPGPHPPGSWGGGKPQAEGAPPPGWASSSRWGSCRDPPHRVRWRGDGADPGFKELVKGPRRRLVGIKPVASAGCFVSCHKPRLAWRRPPPARCRVGRVGERALTLPPAVSPQTSHPGSPFSSPFTIHPREMGEQTLRTRCLCEAGGSRRCCVEVHCAPAARQDPLPAPSPTFALPLPLAGHCPGTYVRKQRRHSSLFTRISTC